MNNRINITILLVLALHIGTFSARISHARQTAASNIVVQTSRSQEEVRKQIHVASIEANARDVNITLTQWGKQGYLTVITEVELAGQKMNMQVDYHTYTNAATIVSKRKAKQTVKLCIDDSTLKFLKGLTPELKGFDPYVCFVLADHVLLKDIVELAAEERKSIIVTLGLHISPYNQLTPQKQKEFQDLCQNAKVTCVTQIETNQVAATIAPKEVTTQNILASTSKNWPKYSGELNGGMEVRVKNPNEFGVKVGLRAAGMGKDFVVGANDTKSVQVPNGRYDIYFQYSTDPDGLYQGDSFTLNGNGVEIQIVKVVNGNYGIRKVK